ncbi:TetR/AcrR family transcriptional regulator C-terminal domain-containing protein [Georgenia satyanarayanai]|uniref:TetR/AcrR family transcriptional regulator n=1 Tax=Georgenia satyanarayanai TaxID=860221 RepID=UPI00203DEBDC|nr:TetR/AcrR family transcriptional regulator [Georgenia satyanarayanai]MCM3660636.1 TetR/AcrR family transcriptional regulator C-terminal domain-containing protein [Georgenia satyanarayanai]
MTLHESHTDPRTRRTLALLERAMTTLLEDQSISEINVSELCRVAGIHRTTFYKHFSSVAEFAAYMFSSLINDLASVDVASLPDEIDQVTETYRGALAGMLDHVAGNRPSYRRLFASDGDHQFQRIVADAMAERALEAHRRLAERGRVIDIDERTAAQMVGAACAAAVGVWAEQDTTDSATRSREIMSGLPMWWPSA